MKITSLLFWVQENKVSERFYKKIGFEVIRSDDTHSVVSLNGFDIVLVNMRDEDVFAGDSMTGAKGKGLYVYVAADNVDAKYAELVASGVQPATQPKDWEWGNREFIVKDPDGYKLCFWHTIK
jgi:uncharacterized glyoxalase superfamily protein PhnB